MNACELTAAVTALANTIACGRTVDELNLMGVILTQLGDTILTIATQREICCAQYRIIDNVKNLPLGEGGPKGRMRAAHRRCAQLRRKAELEGKFLVGQSDCPTALISQKSSLWSRFLPASPRGSLGCFRTSAFVAGALR